MSLDHDQQNLSPLSDDDREALEIGYVAMANSIPGNPGATGSAAPPFDPEGLARKLEQIRCVIQYGVSRAQSA